MKLRNWVVCLLMLVWLGAAGRAEEHFRLGVFDIDASPPIGSPLAYDPNTEVQTPLSCRGVVLVPAAGHGVSDADANRPIVLCAVDWIGIANASNQEFREMIAKAAGTTPSRVAVHTLHQHDAPWCDFSTDALIDKYKIGYRPLDSAFAREVLGRLQPAIAAAVREARPVTHVGFSTAEVKQVASNRRILGPDGKVAFVRYTATKDAKIREFPEGTIDPLLRMITFWNGDQPLAVLTYYATHPQSYYRTGKANPDFPGLARNARQQATGVPHIHFNGAGGNIGAGKYNDGSPENRAILAGRVTDAMERAWKTNKKSPISAKELNWTTVSVSLPPSEHLAEQPLLALVEGKETSAEEPQKPGSETKKQRPTEQERFIAATKLAWLRRCMGGERIKIGCLALGDARVLHMPGELFVEYQLEAQRLCPDRFVAMAAYGDYGPAYIGTAIAYSQGGYETQPNSSFVAPEVEGVLMQAIAKLLEVDADRIRPLRSKE